MRSRIELQVVEGELVGEPDGALLEVVAHREVAQHLEERAVPRGETDPSMSVVRKHFCTLVSRRPGGSAMPMK